MKNMIDAVVHCSEKAQAKREAFIATMTAKHNADKAKFLVNVAERMLKMTSLRKMIQEPTVKFLVNDFIVNLCTDVTVLEAEKIGITDTEEINALGEEARTFAQESLDMLAESFAQFKAQEGIVLH